MKASSVKVIFDTNVWISFLIGKRLMFKLYCRWTNNINHYPAILDEIKAVTSREKLKNYFPKKSVNELIELLEAIAVNIEIKPTHFINRDPKDNFLLDLIDFSKADYLVTGDKDLLLHNPFKTATILTPANFEKAIAPK